VARRSEGARAGRSCAEAESLPAAALPARPPRSRLCPLSFLGYVDMLGVAYEAPTLATGYGAYLAQVAYALARLPQPCVAERCWILCFFPSR